MKKPDSASGLHPTFVSESLPGRRWISYRCLRKPACMSRIRSYKRVPWCRHRPDSAVLTARLSATGVRASTTLTHAGPMLPSRARRRGISVNGFPWLGASPMGSPATSIRFCMAKGCNARQFWTESFALPNAGEYKIILRYNESALRKPARAEQKEPVYPMHLGIQALCHANGPKSVYESRVRWDFGRLLPT